MNNTLKTILTRRSVRDYIPKQIENKELQEIIEAGKFAPNGMNNQSWHFTVIQNKELLNKINISVKEAFLNLGEKIIKRRIAVDNFSVYYNAPTIVVVSGNEKIDTIKYDCTLALGYMFLAAQSLGIGSCWISSIGRTVNTDYGQNLLKDLRIPSGYKIYCAGAFGYKANILPAFPRKENVVDIIK